MELRNILVILVGLFLRFYKLVEFWLLYLFKCHVEETIITEYSKLGIIFDFNEDIKKRSGYNEDYVKHKSEYAELLHVKVHDKVFFLRMANVGPLGMGESYMDGIWDCQDLTELCKRLTKKKLFLQYFHPWNRFLNYIQFRFMNLQTKRKAWEVGKGHYDLGNDLFKSFLDPWMTYSCGYWANGHNLDEAQIHKMELVAKKLKMKPGMRVLDIGCGWGGLCKFLAKNYGVDCVGITISKEGAKYAMESCKDYPVDIRLMDYRDLHEKFDRIVSVEMFEHVGVHNHREYFKVIHRCLKDDGIFLLQTSGTNHKEMEVLRSDSWLLTYIFPNGCLPNHNDITKGTDGLFILQDWHNFGPDYATTLHSWIHKFDKNWPKISAKYGERFYRMWMYYLRSCAGGFESRVLQLWQIVLSKDGLLESNYRAPR